jgi:hypothetical protein
MANFSDESDEPNAFEFVGHQGNDGNMVSATPVEPNASGDRVIMVMPSFALLFSFFFFFLLLEFV